MDNQYTYYTESDINQKSRQQNEYGEPPRKKRCIPKWIKAASLGLVFGLFASAAFQTSNIIAEKAAGKEASDSKSVASVESTRLTTSGDNSVITSDVSDIVKNAMPSVVSITNMSVQQVQSFFGGIQEQEIESAGSGIIVGQNDTELLIVTNNHVVEGSETLTVTFIDEESVEANIKGTDSSCDLAVVSREAG